jgi:hypothetical protein
MLSSFMLSVVYPECYKLALYAECHYAECHAPSFGHPNREGI